jgi:excisionase family DNA binding protein
MRRLIPIDQAAKDLSCSPRTVRRFIAESRLTGYRVGDRLLRVDAAEVESLARPIPTASF